MLLRLQNAGMLEWSHVDREPPQYRQFADAVTMTSFAVYKDEGKDRLISWPRVQNLYMPDPPYTALPNPGHFSKIRCDTETPLAGFRIDIENMFHNIRLPRHVASAFPLPTVSFGSLPGDLQRSLQQELGYKPPQNARMRPLQTALPMGFKWAVYIAHSFVQSCYEKALETFLSTSKTIQPSLHTPNVFVLHTSPGILPLEPATVLVLHIIDDLNFIFAGWPRGLIVSFQGILHSKGTFVAEHHF